MNETKSFSDCRTTSDIQMHMRRKADLKKQNDLKKLIKDTSETGQSTKKAVDKIQKRKNKLSIALSDVSEISPGQRRSSQQFIELNKERVSWKPENYDSQRDSRNKSKTLESKSDIVSSQSHNYTKKVQELIKNNGHSPMAVRRMKAMQMNQRA